MLNLRSLNRFILISLALFGLSVSSVNAIIIDFESLSLSNNSVNIAGPSYVEGDFQFIDRRFKCHKNTSVVFKICDEARSGNFI